MTRISLTTTRLILRDLEKEDLEAMCFLCLDPSVTKYIDYIRKDNKQDVENWLNWAIKHNKKIPRYAYNLAIVLQETGEVIGWIGMGKPDDETLGDLDFGYALMKDYQGKGLGTEALQVLINFGISLENVRKLFGECDKENIASQKIMQKCGMKLEAEFVGEDGKDTLRFSIETS